jgi:predicted secreted protein with PEFG-CTERM motif
MPEFGTIALVVFAVALVGIIAVTAKSRLTSNNVTPNVGGKTTMSGNVYKLAMVGILGIIIFGGYMAISGYNSDIYPLDRIRGNLDGIITSSDPAIIRDHLVAIQTDLDLVMANIPEITDKNGNVISKNPVWLFGTESTNFLRIQNNIDTMFAGLDEISSLSKDNSAYHTGMLDINDRALILKINIMDATPYMYVSPANMMFSVIWIAAIIGIFAMLKRKKENLQKEDEIGI